MPSVGFSGEINREIHLLGSEENDKLSNIRENQKADSSKGFYFH